MRWRPGRGTRIYRMYPWRQPSGRLLLRRVLLALSGSLFVIGASLLGTGLYNYVQQSEENPFAFLREATARPRPTPTLSTSSTGTPSATGTATATETATTPASSPPVAMKIPAIGVDAPVITLGIDPNSDPPAPEVPDDIYAKNTENAVGVIAWYNFSSPPGSGSNAVFAAHVTWNRQPAVFWGLKDLQEGDTIVIISSEGKELVYQVFANFLVDPDDPDALKVMWPTEEDLITLITCGGQWLPNPSEPFGGDYSNRVIVQARPVAAGG